MRTGQSELHTLCCQSQNYVGPVVVWGFTKSVKQGAHHLFPIDNSFLKMKHGCRRFLQRTLLFPGACWNRNRLESGESNE